METTDGHVPGSHRSDAVTPAGGSSGVRGRVVAVGVAATRAAEVPHAVRCLQMRRRIDRRDGHATNRIGCRRHPLSRRSGRPAPLRRPRAAAGRSRQGSTAPPPPACARRCPVRQACVPARGSSSTSSPARTTAPRRRLATSATYGTSGSEGTLQHVCLVVTVRGHHDAPSRPTGSPRQPYQAPGCSARTSDRRVTKRWRSARGRRPPPRATGPTARGRSRACHRTGRRCGRPRRRPGTAAAGSRRRDAQQIWRRRLASASSACASHRRLGALAADEAVDRARPRGPARLAGLGADVGRSARTTVAQTNGVPPRSVPRSGRCAASVPDASSAP